MLLAEIDYIQADTWTQSEYRITRRRTVELWLKIVQVGCPALQAH